MRFCRDCWGEPAAEAGGASTEVEVAKPAAEAGGQSTEAEVVKPAAEASGASTEAAGGSSAVTSVTRKEVSKPTEADHVSLALEVDNKKIKETKKIKNHNHNKKNNHNNNDHN